MNHKQIFLNEIKKALREYSRSIHGAREVKEITEYNNTLVVTVPQEDNKYLARYFQISIEEKGGDT